jgi:hypothetical protein
MQNQSQSTLYDPESSPLVLNRVDTTSVYEPASPYVSDGPTPVNQSFPTFDDKNSYLLADQIDKSPYISDEQPKTKSRFRFTFIIIVVIIILLFMCCMSCNTSYFAGYQIGSDISSDHQSMPFFTKKQWV